jgi:hypothetical protein
MVELETDLLPAKYDRTQKSRRKQGEPFLVPQGTKLLSRGVEVKCSHDYDPVFDGLKTITDGNKEQKLGNYEVTLIGPDLQWVQLDLRKPYALYAILVWHYYLPYAFDYLEVGEQGYLARVYQDVVIQISNDPSFKKDVTTVFNNDHDNSSGFGKGEDDTYIETSEGLWVDPKGVAGRYVRLYSRGHIRLWAGEEKIPIEKYAQYIKSNDYIEVEVYGK